MHSDGGVTLPHRHSRSKAKQIKTGFTALPRCSVSTHKADGMGGRGSGGQQVVALVL